jgi:hypothetical protein
VAVIAHTGGVALQHVVIGQQCLLPGVASMLQQLLVQLN